MREAVVSCKVWVRYEMADGIEIEIEMAQKKYQRLLIPNVNVDWFSQRM